MDLSALSTSAHLVGLVASAVLFISFLLYTVLYVVLIGKYRLPKWQGIEFLSGQMKEPWFRLFTLCQVIAFIAGLSYLALICTFFTSASAENRLFALLSLVFAVMFVTLSSEHYFTQLTYVRHRLKDGELSGLAEHTQLNANSLIIARNILAWTLFFGLSSIFAALLFGDGALGLWVRIVFLVNGAFCLLGCVGYSFRKTILNVLFFNGMGLSVILMGLLTLLYLLG